MKRLSALEKFVLAAGDPNMACRINGISRTRYLALKKRARGHFWNDVEFLQFVAFNSKGSRKWFDYCHTPREAKRCGCAGDFEATRKEARMWARS